MKTKLLLLALTFAAVLAPLPARAETEVSLDFFYDNLSPYGDWLTVGDYGTCWRPRDVDADWAPYTDGYWSYTDAGWTWVSYEDFGDICYHYGRWVRTDDVGWCWVPDTDWGPAWVSWRKTDDHIGWAPLPPEAHWRSSVGFSVWVDDYCDIGPSYYNFCPIVDFGAPVLRGVCVSRSRAFGLFGLSVNITNITYNNYGHHVFCGGPDYVYVNRYSHRQVPALKLVQNTTINNNVTIINNQRIVRAPRNAVAGNTLQVFAPKVVNTGATAARQPKITQVIARPQIDKGWTGVKDPAQAKELRAKVKAESKGLTPETAPAKPVQVTDLKPLPEKADTTVASPVQAPQRPGKGKDKSVVARPAVEQPAQVPGATAQPGKVATDQPEKPAKVGKAGKVARPPVTTETQPGVATENPLRKPFREQPTTAREPGTPTTPETVPAAPTKKGKKGEARIAREPAEQPQVPRAQQPQDAEIAQRRMAEQAERQRQAAAAAQTRRQMDAQRSPQAPQEQAERRQQQQAEAAQRQGAMQRQAEAQQRQIQAQREIQSQRPPQAQRPQPQAQRPPQQVQRPQPQPQRQPQQPSAGKGKQLSPEEIEQLKKKNR